MIKIAIIEDNAQYRATLSTIMHLNEDISIIHMLEDCEYAIAYFELELPDVVLMDIDMPGKSGIQGVWEIKQKWPHVKVIMLTVFEDEEKIFGAIKAGANGYLLKKDTPDKILQSIKNVFGGESPMNGFVASRIIEYFHEESRSHRHLLESHLSSREQEILGLLIKGNSYKQIAALLFISVETLNSHIKNIYRKLNVHSRSELSARFRN
jgi:DNA-binding NarL/FixJ family response regulator